MRAAVAGWVCALVLLVPSCKVLDTVIPVYDADTGTQVGTTTVGDVAADAIDSSSGGISDAISGVLSGMTGNPAVGGAAGWGVLSLLTAGAGAMRRRKNS